MALNISGRIRQQGKIMKYIFLIASIVFGISGISQAMDAFKTQVPEAMPVVFQLESIMITFQPFPGFLRVILLSLSFFMMFLIWRRIISLGLRHLTDYMPS